MRQFLDLRHLCIFGGVSQRPQVQELRRGIDILVATPGRLLDLHGQGLLDISGVEFVVLDEADRMLDMGFIHDMRRVFKALPPDRQSLLFSATMPDPIAKLAAEFLNDPIRVEVDKESTTVKKSINRLCSSKERTKRRYSNNFLRTLRSKVPSSLPGLNMAQTESLKSSLGRHQRGCHSWK